MQNPPLFPLQHTADLQVGFPLEMSAHADGASEGLTPGSEGEVDEHHGGTRKEHESPPPKQSG